MIDILERLGSSEALKPEMEGLMQQLVSHFLTPESPLGQHMRNLGAALSDVTHPCYNGMPYMERKAAAMVVRDTLKKLTTPLNPEKA